MPRKDPSTSLNSKVFKAAMEAYAEEKYGSGTKKIAAIIDLSKVLPEPVEKDTIRTWPYKSNPAVGAANLKAINEFLGIDCSLEATEPAKRGKNDRCATESQLALDFYSHLANFVNCIYLEPSTYMDEIEDDWLNLLNEFEWRTPFLSKPMKSLFENAMAQICLPLTQVDTYTSEYSPEIGHFADGVFHVDDIQLLVKTHEEVMAPFKKKLEELAENIKLLLK